MAGKKAAKTPEIGLLLFIQELYKYEMNLIDDSHEYILISKIDDKYMVWYPREENQYYLENAELNLDDDSLLKTTIDNAKYQTVKIYKRDLDQFRKTVQSRVGTSYLDEENSCLRVEYKYTVEDPNAVIEVEEKVSEDVDVEQEKPTRIKKPKIEIDDTFPIYTSIKAPDFYKVNVVSSKVLPNEMVDEKNKIIHTFLDENNNILFENGLYKLLNSSNNNFVGIIKTFGKSVNKDTPIVEYDKYKISYCKESGTNRNIVMITSKGYKSITYNQYFATVISRKNS